MSDKQPERTNFILHGQELCNASEGWGRHLPASQFDVHYHILSALAFIGCELSVLRKELRPARNKRWDRWVKADQKFNEMCNTHVINRLASGSPSECGIRQALRWAIVEHLSRQSVDFGLGRRFAQQFSAFESNQRLGNETNVWNAMGPVWKLTTKDDWWEHVGLSKYMVGKIRQNLKRKASKKKKRADRKAT